MINDWMLYALSVLFGIGVSLILFNFILVHRQMRTTPLPEEEPQTKRPPRQPDRTMSDTEATLPHHIIVSVPTMDSDDDDHYPGRHDSSQHGNPQRSEDGYRPNRRMEGIESGKGPRRAEVHVNAV